MISASGISKLTDRTTGGPISADADDNEFNQIINTLNAHTDAADGTGTHGVGAGAIVGTTSSQTLTNKTLTSPVITTSPTAAGATWTDLGTVSAATSITSSVGNFADGHVYGQPLCCSRTIIAPDATQAVTDFVPMLAVDDSWAPYGIYITSAGVTVSAKKTYTIELEDWAGDPPAHSADVHDISTAGGDASSRSVHDAINTTVAVDHVVGVDLPTTDVDWIQVWFTYEIKAS